MNYGSFFRFGFSRHAFLLTLAFFTCVFSAENFAVIETYEFTTSQNRERYQIFVDELRCPKCQNQNLSGSNSPIAKDLRRQVHRMVEAGDNNQAIEDFMVKRYGNFVLYKPPMDSHTVILWLFPVLLFVIALVWILLSRRQQGELPKGELTAEEQKNLEIILKRYS